MFGFHANRKLEEIREAVRRNEGGVHKRIDENRELLELIQRSAPEFLAANPWVEGWLDSQDRFLTHIAELTDVQSHIQHRFPRPWPGRPR